LNGKPEADAPTVDASEACGDEACAASPGMPFDVPVPFASLELLIVLPRRGSLRAVSAAVLLATLSTSMIM